MSGAARPRHPDGESHLIEVPDCSCLMRVFAGHEERASAIID
jgi:hypothetical protein